MSSGREEIGKKIDILVEFIRSDLPTIYPKFLAWFFESQDNRLTPKQLAKIKDGMGVTEMFRTKVLAEREEFLREGIGKGIEEGILIDKQHVVIDLLTLKFGPSDKTDRKIRSISDIAKLDKALKKVLFAKTRDEVMLCLK